MSRQDATHTIEPTQFCEELASLGIIQQKANRLHAAASDSFGLMIEQTKA
jgi:hypothetical protein